MTELSMAFDTIKKAIQSDESYAWSWHCNIAMAYKDEGASHELGNKAANRFMQLVFNVDTKEPVKEPK